MTDTSRSDDLVERLRSVDVSWSETGEWCAEAADRIEALEAENERLSYNGIHTCSDACQRLPCVQRREIERLRGALELADAALSGANMNMNVVKRKVRAALGEKQ